MRSLFGHEINTPRYKTPLTARDRAARLREKVEKKKAQLKERGYLQFNPADFDLTSFPRAEVQSAFIGQNLYIKPSYVVSMPEYCFFNRETGEVISQNPRLSTEAFIENQKNLENNDAAGRLSKKAITGLRNSINWLCLAAKKKRVFMKKENKNFFFKVNFVTLTLPDTEKVITSQDLQKLLLNPFLTYMRKYHGLRNYVWRIEFQANGKLHVHLTADTFLHHRKVRDAWNRLLDKNGYLEQFVKKHKHKDPNSTDVHSTRKIKNMAAYLAKYMSKKGSEYKLGKRKKVRPLGVHNPKAWYLQRVNFWNSPFNPRPITGRIWGCSKELSRANKTSVHIPATECQEELRCFMRPDIQFKELYSEPPKNTNKISPYAIPGVVPEKKKIGEVFFLQAADWLTKITGVVRTVFDETRWLLSKAGQPTVFELS